MSQLLVRGLDVRVVQALREPAARAGRSAEAEHRAILEEVLGPETEGFAALAARLRSATPLPQTDSAILVRQDRDRDHPMPE